MTLSPLRVSLAAVRRYLVRAFALNGFQALPHVAAAVERLQFVQEDSINVCGRIHDLILWPRVAGYTPQDLHQYLYEAPRQGFEYYFPNLSVLPLSDYSCFLRSMHNRAAAPGRWHGLQPEEEPVAEDILTRLDAAGPLRTRSASGEHGHSTSGWGTRQTMVNRVTEKLWLHGALTVERRVNFERWFDRTERLLPGVADLPLPTPEEEHVLLVLKRLRARRLFRLKKGDAALLGTESFVAVEMEGDRRPWHILAEDAPTLMAAEAEPVPDTLHLLAPLDPLVYDRERNRAAFDFDYTWEVYTPAARRRWGYYVLPVLFGDRLIGRVDPKIDRKAGVLQLHSVRLEPGVAPEEVSRPLAERIRDFARFLGASQVSLGIVEPEELRPLLENHLAGV